jgi:hypothetical protein
MIYFNLFPPKKCRVIVNVVEHETIEAGEPRPTDGQAGEPRPTDGQARRSSARDLGQDL